MGVCIFSTIQAVSLEVNNTSDLDLTGYHVLREKSLFKGDLFLKLIELKAYKDL